MAPELRDQLQASLGTAYTIERELGGGMSRVFVADEVRLERTVVVKVLPPQMAAGVSVDRFGREIRFAAKSTTLTSCRSSLRAQRATRCTTSCRTSLRARLAHRP